MIAIIPARGGSKGVPGKNIKLLNGAPLISYTIAAAYESNVFDRVIVSTDSEEIAEVSIKYGAEVPFLRPKSISGDMASSDDAIIHALNYFEEKAGRVESVCKLQATSPLRDAGHIIEAYKLFSLTDVDFVVSVCECEHSPFWTGVLDETFSLDGFIKEEYKRACRQSFPQYYRLNGAIYMGKTDAVISQKSFLGPNGKAYVMQQEDSIDIDSVLDFRIAEMIMKERRSNA